LAVNTFLLATDHPVRGLLLRYYQGMSDFLQCLTKPELKGLDREPAWPDD
jgi:hypothetical protein